MTTLAVRPRCHFAEAIEMYTYIKPPEGKRRSGMLILGRAG